MNGRGREYERLLAALVTSAAGVSAQGGVIEFDDKDAWIAAAGEFTTIGFTEVPNLTFLSNHYADLGVVFSDGNDITRCCGQFETWPNDGAGLDGNGNITLAFDEPQASIASDFPGFLQIELYRKGQLIYASGLLGVGGVGNFGGLVSGALFDTAVLMDFPPEHEAEIDDFHFGGSVCPADLDGDGAVAVPDLLALLAAWGTDPGGPPDLDGDGAVAVPDLLALLASWGPCVIPPEPCLGDLDDDSVVGVADLLLLLAAWGTSPGGPVDVDGDGVIAIPDLLLLLVNWGPCP